MPNILDAIQVSGASYDLKDKNAPSVSSLTQSEYDNLPSTAKTSNTFFVITDAQAGDLTNYYTKTETDNAITAGTSTKQDTLVSGTNIKTINNESILGSGNIDIQGGGGGKAVTGGTNISVTTGETADTINCTLPITTSNNNRCIITGTEGNKGSAEGMGTYESFITGRENKATNYAEAAFGRYNRSNHNSNTFGDSGNTLFSVGNGTGSFTSDRHNAFEIRQNGDIYCSDGTNDVKLQDTITATAANTTALGGLSLVKLTQAEYDALATKDNSTLYVIVN